MKQIKTLFAMQTYNSFVQVYVFVINTILNLYYFELLIFYNLLILYTYKILVSNNSFCIDKSLLVNN